MDPISNVLAAKARDRIRLKSCQGSRFRVMRAEVAVPRRDALEWLRGQQGSPKVYWSGRETSCEVAGCGAVDQLIADDVGCLKPLFERMAECLASADPAVRYYGGLRFASTREREPVWLAFGDARFFLPRFELRNTQSGSTLACHWLDSAHDTEELFDALGSLEPGLPATGCHAVIGRADLPDAHAWRTEVNETLRRLRDGALEKLVLARQSVFECARELDPLACLEILSARAAHCYRFCLMPSRDAGFLGLSPERLYRRSGRRIFTEAIAGTRPRGSDLEEDTALERELIESNKERREQAYVVRGVKERVAPLCETFDTSREVSVLKLQECQHLMTEFCGNLRARTGDLEVLCALHPTPAVGGYPVDAALRELARIEPFDRGWYAAPIGWVGTTAAEFAVAIRSGVVEGRKLKVYAGAGIVEGSVAENEWRELDNKIRHFTRILGLS